MSSRGFGGRGRGWRGRGRPWGRGRGGPRRDFPPPPPIVRPIFDWSEGGEYFPKAGPVLDSSLLTQLLTKRVADITPSIDEQSLVADLCTKVSTVVENMILTGEGEHLLLDEVRQVGSHKNGTALAGNMMADLVIILREIPAPALVEQIGAKIQDQLNSAAVEDGGSPSTAGRREEGEGGEGGEGGGKVNLTYVAGNVFQLGNARGAVTRVYVTTTGDKVYGFIPPDIVDVKPFQDALRMVRHVRWWEDHTVYLKSVRSLVRILKDMRTYVPGLQFLNPWYLQLLCNCAVIPLIGDEPLSLVDGFRRLWELLSAGLLLPGSIGIPDPCEESDGGFHESLSPSACDEIARNAQFILQMLYFGAYREVLAMDGATPVKFSEAYSFGGVTLSVPTPAYDKTD